MEGAGIEGRCLGSTGGARAGVEDGDEDASNYIEHVDVLSLTEQAGPPPVGYWKTVREVIRIKRERAAAEALVSLPARLVSQPPTRDAAQTQHAQAQAAHPLEQTVRVQFERAVGEAALPRQSRHVW